MSEYPVEDSGEQADAHPQLKFVRGLLDGGADPNAVTASSTIWGDFLEHLHTAYHRSRIFKTSNLKSVWALMVMAFLDNGAKTAQIWNLRSGALNTVNNDVFNFDGKINFPDCKIFLYEFRGSFSTFTILHKCLRHYDEWPLINNRLDTSNKKHLSKCTRFYFTDPGPKGWGPCVGYPLSDQQSEDFLQVYEPCTDELEAPSSCNPEQLLRHVLSLRCELEGGASGAEIELVELDWQ